MASCSFSTENKTLDFIGITTQTVAIEGENADHKTDTTQIVSYQPVFNSKFVFITFCPRSDVLNETKKPF